MLIDRTRRAGAVLVAGALLVIGGCASTAGIESSAQPLEPGRLGLDSAEQAAMSSVAPIDRQWWLQFNDSTLDELVTLALAGNPDLRVAQARLARTSAVVGAAEANDGLQLTGSAAATRQHFSANSIYPAPLGGSTRTLGSLQADASYEFDFFGRNRAAIEAAVGMQRTAQAEAEAARILLAANVARAYVQLGHLQAQREVAVRSLAQRTEILDLIKGRVRSGLDTKVELRQGEGALPESRRQIEQIDEQIALARHTLAALTAQAPGAYDELSVTLKSVPLVKVPSSLPADLLGRRADISAARWRIEAAVKDVASARASFYPNINLTGFVGLSSIGLNNLVDAGSRQFGVGPALSLPLFDSGRLRANLRGKTADLDLAIESYNGAVLDAVHQVADQISSVHAIARQQAEQNSARESAESAFALAKERFKAGLSTYLTVLNAEASVLNQRRLAVDLKARAIDTQIALIQALGGGFADVSVNPSQYRISLGESK